MIASTLRLDRTVVIHARPATVFEFFSNPQDWASWWGAGSTIDARPGGHLLTVRCLPGHACLMPIGDPLPDTANHVPGSEPTLAGGGLARVPRARRAGVA